MKTLFHSLARKDDGSTAVEFALVAPLMLLILFGVFESGRALLVHNNLRYALDQASRYAMVHPMASTSTIESEIANTITAAPVGDVVVAVESEMINGKTFKHISLTYPFDTVIGSMLGTETVNIAVDATVPVLP